MRALLYGLGWLVMCGAATGIGLLPHFSHALWLFLVFGAVLSGLIAGAWAVLGATAGSWPRPRTGWVLIVTGMLLATVSAALRQWFDAFWNLLMVLAGLGFIVPVPTRPRVKEPDEESLEHTVRPPLGRRETL